jgi:HEAT repeat protein
MDEHLFTENDLSTNLNELAHETIRELYNAAKKIAVYSVSHPLAQKAVGRPFLQMEKAFRFKHFFNLHIAAGQLYAMNIKIRSSIFSEQIMDYMQVLDLKDILFENKVSVNHLTMFLDRLVKKVSSSENYNLMTGFLEKNKIDTIRVNNEVGLILFERGRKFFGDVAGYFSVRNIAEHAIGDDIERIAGMLSDEQLPPDQYIIRNNHDFSPRLIRTLVPEKIAEMEIDYLVSRVADIICVVVGIDDGDRQSSNSAREFLGILNYHPEREDIINRLDNELSQRGIRREVYSELISPVSAIKIESAEKIDLFLKEVFTTKEHRISLTDFQDHFGRLLRTGQQGKAKSVINYLLENLAGNNLLMRQRALELLSLALGSHRNLSGSFLFEHLIYRIDEFVVNEKETFEFSDLIWEMAKICLAEKNYEHLSSLCTTLSKKCHHIEGVVVFDSLTVKKAIAELDRREVINQLVWELIESSHAYFPAIKNILVTIGSEEVAFALSHLISHESRHLRQNVLKILSELGKASLNVFTRIMEDNANFVREAHKRELADAKWYVVRNSIFVLGALKDPEGCKALRMRIADEDVRLRRNIVTALEKIGGEQAIELLLVMAEDNEREIREGAIISLGIVGRQEIVPELIVLAQKRHTEIINVIVTLGKLGGDEAKKFLSNLLIDAELQSQLTSNRSSRDELRLATIKALGRIGDRDSLETIRKFTDTLSSSQKIFLGAGKLNKIAEDILSKHDK